MSNDVHETIEEEALSWFVRLRGEDRQSLQSEFDAWIARSPAHASAYERIARHFEQSAVLKLARPRPSAGAGYRKWLPLALAATVMLLLAFLLLFAGRPGATPPSRTVTLATGPQQIRTFTLQDGSRVTLDADSRAQVLMGPGQRRLTVSRGQTRIAVAPEARPFLASAGGGFVRTNAATFDLGFADPGYGGGRQVEVALRAGSAGVFSGRENAAYAAPARSLIRGRPLTYTSRQFMALPARSSGIDRRDWPSGWIECRAISLAELIRQANRYARHPIVLDDPATGRLLVMGRFQLTQTTRIASHVAEVFGLAVVPENGAIHLRKK